MKKFMLQGVYYDGKNRDFGDEKFSILKKLSKKMEILLVCPGNVGLSKKVTCLRGRVAEINFGLLLAALMI